MVIELWKIHYVKGKSAFKKSHLQIAYNHLLSAETLLFEKSRNDVCFTQTKFGYIINTRIMLAQVCEQLHYTDEALRLYQSIAPYSPFARRKLQHLNDVLFPDNNIA